MQVTLERFNKLLNQSAKIINKCCGFFTIRFIKPLNKSEYEAEQVIKSISFRPTEAIILCGFYYPLFYAAEEMMRMFSGYLCAGASEGAITRIKGKAYKIWYHVERDRPGEFSS